MPYQDAGQQSHQLATWAHSITQGRSPPEGGTQAHAQKSSYRKAVETQLFMWGVLFDSEHTFASPTIRAF